MKTNQIAIGILLVLILPIIVRSEPVKLETVYSIFAEIYRDDYGMLKVITSDPGIISTFPVLPQEYSVKVLGPRNQILFDKDIDVSFDVFLEPLKVIRLNSTVMHVRVPYFENAMRVKIYHLSKVILDVDLSEEICNNNFICESGENKYNCPNDCEVKKRFPWILYLIIVFLLVGLIFLLLKFLRK